MAKYRFTVYRDLVRAGAPTEDAQSREARVRVVRAGNPVVGGSFVLYWMQMYMRGSENAALNEAIRRANRAIVCEGYFDRISLHRAELGEALATCGTALTPAHHAAQLARHATASHFAPP